MNKKNCLILHFGLITGTLFFKETNSKHILTDQFTPETFPT